MQNLSGIHGREAEVLDLLSEGCTFRQAATELGISVATVGHHLDHIVARTGFPRLRLRAAWLRRKILMEGAT